MTPTNMWRYSSRDNFEFSVMICVSLLIHLALFAIILLAPRAVPKKHVLYTPVYHVDLVTLKPAKMSKPALPPPPPPKVKTPAKKKTLPAPKPETKKMALPKPEPAKKKMPAPALEVKPKPKEKPAYPQARPAIEELKKKYQKNRVDQEGVGGLNSGISREILRLQFKQYYNTVREKVKAGWAAPPELAGQRRLLEVNVGVVIARSGEIISVKLEDSSGNSYFDQSVLRAIWKANPLPELPDSYKGDTYELGFHFNNME